MDGQGRGLCANILAAAQAAAPAPDVHAHFDQVAQAVSSAIAVKVLRVMFTSDKTPALGQMLSTLFNNLAATAEGCMVNQLLSSVNPAMPTQILGAADLPDLRAAAAGGS